MKKTEIFEGQELRSDPPQSVANVRCRFVGMGAANAELAVPLDDDLLSRHILFLGSIGTGKTNAIFHLISQLRCSLSRDDVMLIFDTKGDFHDEFYTTGDIVISNDTKATGPSGPDYWNLFRELSLGTDVEADIIEVTRTLFHERTERSNQPFFPNAARDLLTAILLHFMRTGDGQSLNNAQLRAYLDRSPTSALRDMLQTHDDLRAITSYIGDDRSPQTQGVISELQQMMREVLVGNFRREGSLSVREAVRAKGARTIFIEYDMGIGNMLTPIYRLLLDLAIKEALCRRKSEGNVWFVIDEFRLVPNLQHVDDGVNFGRSRGSKFIIGVQNVEHLYHIYGEHLARSILSGFMTKVAFNVSDMATREFVQNIFGRNRKLESFSSKVAGKSVYEQVRDANVVEDWDMTNLPIGKAVIGLPEQEPFLFQFKPYRTTKTR
jgi:type IV secretory pathway TraG/TraD family ATPase VirD4